MATDWEQILDTSGAALAEVYEDAVAEVVWTDAPRPTTKGRLWAPAELEPEIFYTRTP